MKESINGIEPHSIILSGTGVFPNEQYIKVIWVGIQQADHLNTIATRLNEKLGTIGFKREKRNFSAHLTLGRMRSARGKDHVLDIMDQYKETIFATVPVQEIILKKSTLTLQGPIYETITRVPLATH
jgi:2'-5' RNA ligase